MIDEVAQVAPPARVPPVDRRGRLLDAAAVVALLALFPVVHDVPSLLHAPYFLDEAWVALSVRFPLSQLPLLTSSTPIGWSFLLRLVPDTNDLRAVTLLFHLLTVAGGYALGRQLGWRSPALARIGGLACGAVVLLLPAQQVRHDLKQYTADAAVTLILFALTARLEAQWSRRRLIALGAVLAGGTLFSHIAPVVGGCALTGLVLVALVRRQWPRLREVLLVGTAASALAGLLVLTLAYRSHSKAMLKFWTNYFPGPRQLPHYVWQHLKALAPLLGTTQGTGVLLLLLACCAVGIGVVARLGRPATGVGLALLPVAAVLLGTAHVYPLLDERTSHFLMVTAAATAGIAVAAAAALASSRLRDRRQWLVAAAISLAMVGGYAGANARWYRFDGNKPGVPYRTYMATEDIRSAVTYVRTHMGPRDVIVLSDPSEYGFVFYWQPPDLRIVAPFDNTVGWMVRYSTPTVVIAPHVPNLTLLTAALDRGLALAAQRGPDARVWLVRTHMMPAEQAAWRQVLSGYRVTWATPGVEPVALVSR